MSDMTTIINRTTELQREAGKLCDKCNQPIARGPAIGKHFHYYGKDGLTSTIGRHTVPHESGLCFFHLLMQRKLREGEWESRPAFHRPLFNL